MDDVRRLCNVLKNFQLPQCVFNAIFLTWMNGWITHARFQSYARCRICDLRFTDDSLEHFAVCHIQQGLAQYFFDLPFGGSCKKFVCLENENPEIVKKRAIHLYIFKKAYDFCRHHGGRFSHETLVYSYRSNLVSFFGKYPKLKSNEVRTAVTDDTWICLC